MKIKNIWLINRDLPPVFTGAGINDTLMATRLKEYGFVPTLVGQKKRGDARREIYKSIDILRIGNFGTSLGKVFWGMQLFINVIFSKQKPVLIRFRGFNLGYAIAIFFLKIFYKDLFIVVQPACYGVDDPLTIRNKSLGGWQLVQFLKSDALFAMNGLFRQSFIQHNYPEKKIFAVRNPVLINDDLPKKEITSLRKKLTDNGKFQIVVVTIGIIDPRKRQDFISRAFCKALKENVDKNVVLVHVGPNSNDLPLLKRTDKVKLAESVEIEIVKASQNCDNQAAIKLFGHRNDVSSILTAADIFVHASVSEGESNVVNEAMATGTAIIAPNHPVYELQLNRDFALLFEPDNELSLADALKELINSVNKRRRLGKNALEHVKKTREPRTAAQYYARILEEIIGI